ncbi:MAG: preprotein translocase subunit SecG [Bdellovibrionota bacterium]
MMTFVAVLHVLVALLLIALVLVQDSKGGGALGMGGGGSNSVLGAAGAQTIWAKLTRIIAFIFAATCVGLTYMTASQSKSIIDSVPIAAPVVGEPAANPAATTTTPAAPAATEAAPAETKKADDPKK